LWTGGHRKGATPLGGECRGNAGEERPDETPHDTQKGLEKPLFYGAKKPPNGKERGEKQTPARKVKSETRSIRGKTRVSEEVRDSRGTRVEEGSRGVDTGYMKEKNALKGTVQ